MKKVFWREAGYGVLAGMALATLVTSIAAASGGKRIRSPQTPNLWGYDDGRILNGRATMVRCPVTGEVVVWLHDASREQVELWLLENGWKHTVKGWTK